MKYYLAKTEPSTYSIDDLAKEKTTVWSGVKNPSAVKALKAMQKGDKILIYHSGSESAIVGLAKMSGNSHLDIKEERSWLVDITFVKKFSEPHVTLKDIKTSGLFSDTALVRQGRLSVMEVPEKLIHWLGKKGLPV